MERGIAKQVGIEGVWFEKKFEAWGKEKCEG